MTTETGRRTWASRFLRDRKGNFAMMAAFTFPVILAAAGVAIDLTSMVLAKAELQDATDAAALAAASALANDKKSVGEAKAIAIAFMKTQLADTKAMSWNGTSTIPDPTIDIKETPSAGGGKTFNVAISMVGDVEFSPFTRLLGHESATLNTASSTESATESKSALSMYLVLDKSGSMLAPTDELSTTQTSCYRYNTGGTLVSNKPMTPCYVQKIDALKLAAASLFAQLEEADPNKFYVRTGTVAYNGGMGTAHTITWGASSSLAQVKNLSAGGSTNSSTAMEEAVKKLSDDKENKEHEKKTGLVPKKYIVFMTDGANTEPYMDTATKNTCNSAKSSGMEVYAVAFKAPPAGQKLLKACASSPEHYFAAEKMSDLIGAFDAIGQAAAGQVSRLTN
jgi:Flp pilus assembly protein TadG/uncharacterized protein YegL